MIYKCEVCGREFTSIDEAHKHEKECSSNEGMLKEISDLKLRVQLLENEIALMKSTHTSRDEPNEYNPGRLNVVLCSSNNARGEE